MCGTYKTPMLIAIAHPIFSFVFRFRGMRIFHGSTAKTRSKIPEKAVAGKLVTFYARVEQKEFQVSH